MKCYQCGTERKETNKWFWIRARRSLIIARMDGVKPPKAKPVCGQRCSSILMSEWMMGGSRREVEGRGYCTGEGPRALEGGNKK